MRAIFLSHTGMTEPLGRSQVLPYLRGLAASGWRVEVVGFEPAVARDDEIRAVVDELTAAGLGYTWARRSPSHAFATKLGESANALGRLLLRAVDRSGCAGLPRILHARSTLPAAVAHAVAAAIPRARLLFDCRGLLGEEYVDAGHWQRGSLRHRLVGRAERHLFGRADGIVVLTDALRRHLVEETKAIPRRAAVEVIPCCVDIARFRDGSTEAARDGMRSRLEAEGRFVLAYAGTLGSWYCEEQMAGLYARLRRARPSLFAVYTRADATPLRRALAARGVPDEEVRVLALSPAEMPAALAAADAAVSFIKPCFSKIASSPTKVAEYLAVGLPVALNRGIGDADRLLADCDATIDAGHLDDAALDRAAAALVAAADDPGTRARARRAAERHFSVDAVGVARYRRLYERLAA